MRLSHRTAGVSLCALGSLVFAPPASALAPPPPNQTLTTEVTCAGGNGAAVTLTAPRRVHQREQFSVHLAIATDLTGRARASAALSGAPGVTPAVETFTVVFVQPTEFAGDLSFTATGHAGTLVNWRLDSFTTEIDLPFVIEFSCVPSTPAVLGTTRIIGP